MEFRGLPFRILAKESPAGGGSNDPDQATDRTDPRRNRDHTRGDLGGDAMGGCKPRLPARAWTPLVRSVRRADLSSMVDFPLVVLVRRLCTNRLRRGRRHRRRQWIARLRSRDLRIDLAGTPVEQIGRAAGRAGVWQYV